MGSALNSGMPAQYILARSHLDLLERASKACPAFRTTGTMTYPNLSMSSLEMVNRVRVCISLWGLHDIVFLLCPSSETDCELAQSRRISHARRRAHHRTIRVALSPAISEPRRCDEAQKHRSRSSLARQIVCIQVHLVRSRLIADSEETHDERQGLTLLAYVTTRSRSIIVLASHTCGARRKYRCTSGRRPWQG